ncbi:MAG: hypothetical protein AAF628_22960 [Planctomycetota bacterium]
MKTVSIASVGLLLGLTSCVTRRPDPNQNLSEVSQAGIVAYTKAKVAWADAMAKPAGDPQSRRADLDVVLSHLDDAIANDPRCPLFHHMKGVMFELKSGPEDFDRAIAAYVDALELSEDWVPGHVGLGRVAAYRGWAAAADDEAERDRRKVEAMQHFNNAKLALMSIADPSETAGIDWLQRLTGVSFILPRERDPLDPTLERNSNLLLLLNFMSDALDWRHDNGALLPDLGVPAGSRTDPLRMMKARVAYWGLQVAGPYLHEDPEGYLRTLEADVLRLDPNYLDARIQRAQAFYGLGRFDEAAAVLEPYWTSSNPMVAEHLVLMETIAWVLGQGWLESTADARRLDRATGYFRSLRARNREPHSGTLLCPMFHFYNGKADRDAAALELALKELQNVEAVGAQAPLAERLRAQIEIAQNELSEASS